MNTLPQAAIFCKFGANCPDLNAVFAPPLRAHLEAQTRLFPQVVTMEKFPEYAPRLRELEVIFATWGLWGFSPEHFAALPNLKAVFYAAGSVRGFALPLLERGIVLTSSGPANAIPVAEFCLTQILLANKGYWRNQNEYREREDYGAFRGRGNFGTTVSILGAGQIGRRVVELLRPFSLRALCFDPFLSQKGAESLGVEKVEVLEEAFSRADVVSNHLADVPATQNLITGALFDSMPPNATFINTGRGATVNTSELVEVFSRRCDLTALLDVTVPEPLPVSHPLRALPNVHLSNHIAGSIGEEVARMGQVAIEEFERWRRGKSLAYAVSPQMLETMA